MKTHYLLTDWAVINFKDSKEKRISGKIYNHPSYNNGEEITTSPIIKTSGKVIYTKNSFYSLEGPPRKEYLSWLKENNIFFNQDEPVQIVN